MSLEVTEKNVFNFQNGLTGACLKSFISFWCLVIMVQTSTDDCIFIESDISCKRVDIFYIRLERNRKVDNLPVCVAHLLRKSEVIRCRTFRFVLKTTFYNLSDVVFLCRNQKASTSVITPRPLLAHDWRIILSIKDPSCRIVTTNGRFCAFLDDIELSIDFDF